MYNPYMRKFILLTAVALCNYLQVHAQNKATDSLLRLLATTNEDTSRAMLLNSISRTYIFSKPDTALLLAQQGLSLSRRINFRRGEHAGLRMVGNFFARTGNYPRALEIHLQALKIAEQAKDDNLVVRSLSNLADVYFRAGDMKRSNEYAYRCIVIYKKLHEMSGLANMYINLGDNYEKSDQLDSALYFEKLGLEVNTINKDDEAEGIGLANLGNIYLKMAKLDSAMYYYKSAEPYFAETNNQSGFIENDLGIAKIFLARQQMDSCLFYSKKSFNTAVENGFTDQVLPASNFLANFYRSKGNVDSAYRYLSATIAAKDSLFSQQKDNQIHSMTYEEAIRQQQIEEEKEKARREVRQNALIGGLATLFVVAFVLYRNNRQRRKANVLLLQQKEELQKQKEEIDTKAIQLSEQKENLQQSYNNVERLGEIGRKITSTLSVEKIIGTVYDNVNGFMDASVFGIGIYDDVHQTIDFPATYEDGEALPFYSNSIADQNRFAVICFKQGREIIIGNLTEEHKNYIQEVQTPHEGRQPVSLIYLPLTVKEKKLGVITVQSFQPNAYSDYHLYMLRNIAIYTAIALENAESFQTLNQTLVSLRATQSQLIQSEKMASLGELTAGIAHEIQNPLNFVNNFSEVNEELLSELKVEIEQGNIDEAKRLADSAIINQKKINQHGSRADAIVKGMLQHSRKDAGVKMLTDINALCDEYLRLSYHGLRAKEKNFNSDFKTDLDASIGPIDVVPQDIGRVLLNIYNNAFYAVHEKAMHTSKGFSPAIFVSTKKKNDVLVISVKDNGTGIPDKVIDKIFQPFFTTKPAGRGTGLGLSMSYDIIKAHGGEIRVYTKEKEGTEFIIELPMG